MPTATRGRGEDAAAGAHLAREVLARRLAARVPHTKDDAIELWVADGVDRRREGGQRHRRDRINATTGDPCDWLKDNVTMVCELVPAGRGPAPAEPLVPAGPNVQENYGKAAPAPTYEDLLQTRARRRAVRLLLHEPAGGDQRRRPARRRRSASRRSSATSRRRRAVSFMLVTKIKKPFSHLDADERLRAGRRDLDAHRRAREEDRRPAVA